MEEEDNLTKQVDEIEALSAIYPDEWKTEDEVYRAYQFIFKINGQSADLLLTLPPEYPLTSPPYYHIIASWMKESDKDIVYAQLEEIYMEHLGESILHLWIDKFREFMQDRYPVDTEIAEPEAAAAEEEITKKPPFLEVNEELIKDCPPITSAQPFTDRKSTFQGHAATITSVQQFKAVMAKLCENRKIAQATHNIYAYRIFNEETNTWIQDCEDDGETHAGGRLMHLLQILDVKNVGVVVSRWFGQILLGGDRFKHINNAARDALELGGFIAKTSSSLASDDKKKIKKK